MENGEVERTMPIFATCLSICQAIVHYIWWILDGVSLLFTMHQAATMISSKSIDNLWPKLFSECSEPSLFWLTNLIPKNKNM